MANCSSVSGRLSTCVKSICRILLFSKLFQRKIVIAIIVCGFLMVYVSFTRSLIGVTNSHRYASPMIVHGNVGPATKNTTVVVFPKELQLALLSDSEELENTFLISRPDAAPDSAGGGGHLVGNDLGSYDLMQTERVTANDPEMEEEMACHLPVLNPFDDSILRYVKDPYPVNCAWNKKYPLLFTTDLKSTLIQINRPEEFGYYFCCYTPFRRKKDSEVNVVFSKVCHPIRDKETVIPDEIEFIQISCSRKPSTRSPKRIVDMIGFIPLKKAPERLGQDPHTNTDGTYPEILTNGEAINPDEALRVDEYLRRKISKGSRSDPKEGRKVNVVILGLDAISQMNFIRTMPLSYEYLTKNLSGLGLSGYTKVGDNTFPNIVPVTTGLFVRELHTKGQCWKRRRDNFDNCPFIWKNYSSQGYTTAYGEDAVYMGIFKYQKRGFKAMPTDYYHSTLTRQQDKKMGHANLINAKICYGPRFGFQVLLDYLKKMAVAMNKERRYFQFIWATSLFHDYLNEGKLGDRFLLETLQWFKSEGYFEDTVFILMSDHGIRWGDIRSTLQGKIEERMPFLYFVFPQWFRERYPSAVSNVIVNKNKLTTPFDLHETLKDLLFLDNIKSDNIRHRHLNLQDKLKQSAGLPRGISLFLPIPLKRTCKDAQIPDHWCVCEKTKSVVVKNNSLVREAANSVVYFINEMFATFPQCLKLYLKEILNAQVFQSENRKVADAAANITSSFDPRLNKQQVTFSLSLKVSPSNATFEATATRHTDGEWTVSGDISRTNLYGQQSRCVEDFNLKKFCYCG